MTEQIVYLLEHREQNPRAGTIENVIMHVASTLEKARAKAWELRHELTLTPASWYAIFPELIDSPDLVSILPSDIGEILEFYGPHGLLLAEQPCDGYTKELTILCGHERALTELWQAKKYTEATRAFHQLSSASTDTAMSWYAHLPVKERSLLGQEALAPLLKNASRDQRIHLISILPKAKQGLKSQKGKKR